MGLLSMIEDKYRELLFKMKNEVLGVTTGFKETIQIEKLADEIDIATADSNKSLAEKLQSRQQAYLNRINKCLKKLEDGTYGECESCGVQINERRLLARPTALLCIDCKSEQEKYENREKTGRGILSDLE